MSFVNLHHGMKFSHQYFKEDIENAECCFPRGSVKLGELQVRIRCSSDVRIRWKVVGGAFIWRISTRQTHKANECRMKRYKTGRAMCAGTSLHTNSCNTDCWRSCDPYLATILSLRARSI